MNDQASQCVIQLATLLIDTVREVSPGWSRAFMRLDADDDGVGARMSFLDATGVHLLGAIDHSPAYGQAIELGSQLRTLTTANGKSFLVCLAVADASLNYELLFEYEDPGRWMISKLDGRSGIPEGIDDVKPSVALPAASKQVSRPWYKLWS